MIELHEKAEIFRLRAAKKLPDDDCDRSFCVELRLHVVSLLTLVGPPGVDGEDVRRKMALCDYGEIVDAIARAMVRHRISETRSIGVRVWRVEEWVRQERERKERERRAE